MIRRSVVTVAVAIGLAASSAGIATADQAPTTLAKQASALGITKAGAAYTFHKDTRRADTLTLTVSVPTAWKDRADSHFVHPDTNRPYGVGVRATTNATKFHNSFSVPGVRVTADGVSPAEADAFDGRELVANNAVKGCRNGSLKPYDNGTWEGFYQVFDRCGRNRAAAVVVAGQNGSAILLVAAQVLTKSDLKAIDKILATADLEKSSI